MDAKKYFTSMQLRRVSKQNTLFKYNLICTKEPVSIECWIKVRLQQ